MNQVDPKQFEDLAMSHRSQSDARNIEKTPVVSYVWRQAKENQQRNALRTAMHPLPRQFRQRTAV